MFDVYPYEITLHDGRSYSQARILIFNGWAHVYVMWGGEPRLVARERTTQDVERRRELRQVHTEAGVWETMRSADCGCRSAMKRIPRLQLLELIEAA